MDPKVVQGEAKIFLIALVVVAILWFWSGGYQDFKSRQGPFLKPPAPIGSGEAYGLESTKKTTSESSISSYARAIYFSDTQGIRLQHPNQEFVMIEAAARNNAPIQLTGFKLLGVPYSAEAIIGKGYKTHKGKILEQNAVIMLEAAEKAVIVSGGIPQLPKEIVNSYDPVWIVLLNRQAELWDTRGSILLVDTKGKVIDIFKSGS